MEDISIRYFVQNDYVDSDEWLQVKEVAEKLKVFMSSIETRKLIEIANSPGKKSTEVQNIFLNYAISLGFKDESNGLFSEYKNNRLRPDFYKSIGNHSGILLEVERGKTNQNNMDFLDFWKCHICKQAHYLFLVVPNQLRQNESGKIVGRPFRTVSSHMETFFIAENYTNVRGLALFGY